MTQEEATKNHPGSENSKSSAERETRLYSTGEDDAFASRKVFVSKLNPSCSAFFEHPKQSVNTENAVWYENRPLCVNNLGDVSIRCKLYLLERSSLRYTPTIPFHNHAL